MRARRGENASEAVGCGASDGWITGNIIFDRDVFGAGDDGDFGKLLMDVIKEVNSSQIQATEMQNAFMTGQNVELHELMISMERAGLAMELTLQVRNKLLEAYQEISRMQV